MLVSPYIETTRDSLFQLSVTERKEGFLLLSIKDSLDSILFSSTDKPLRVLDEVEQNIVICQWRGDYYLPNPKAEANN